MTAFAIALVVISALLHAGWNLVGKSSSSAGMAFSLSVSVIASVVLAPYILWFLSTLGWHTLPMAFWGLVVASGACQMVYMAGLMFAYRHADIGVVYPIARGVPILLVGAGAFALGQATTGLQWLGFSAITLGCLLVPLKHFREFNLSAYANLGIVWAVVAALGTAGYSIIDNQALIVMGDVADPTYSVKQQVLFYIGIQFWAMALPGLIYFLLTGQIAKLKVAWQCRYKAGLTALMMASTYSLVLVAMTMTDNVSLVVALRQISIVFGLLLGHWFLKEPWFHTRSVGVAVILAGLILALV
uniref:multidrug transporter n=1 Tax=Thaumasiovibrio occultus TaxID=1891184 RepID=UPI000B352D93|nr:multidrug transporter [Thaumasiovibrio occultus]